MYLLPTLYFYYFREKETNCFIFLVDAVDSDNLNYVNYRLEDNWLQTSLASPPIFLYLPSPNTALLTPLGPLLSLSPTPLPSPTSPALPNPDSTPLIICAVPLLPRAYQSQKVELPFNNPAKYLLSVHHYTKTRRLGVSNLSAVEFRIGI